MFKKMLLTALITTSATAIADDSTSLQFDLEATVPAARYYVEFNDPSFGTGTQEMAWNQSAQKLENISTQLNALNNSGNIEAYIDSDAQLVHETDGSKTIPLTVSIDGKTLPVGAASAVEIVDAATTTEKKLSLVVSPTGTPTYDDGKYNGTVTMNFDHSI
jgi:hypothetical protein